MNKDQTISVPVYKMNSKTPEPEIVPTDYPFEIFLDFAPAEETSELLYSEILSEHSQFGAAEAEILAKPIALASRLLLFQAGFRLRTYPVDGRKLETLKVRRILNRMS